MWEAAGRTEREARVILQSLDVDVPAVVIGKERYTRVGRCEDKYHTMAGSVSVSLSSLTNKMPLSSFRLGDNQRGVTILWPPNDELKLFNASLDDTGWTASEAGTRLLLAANQRCAAYIANGRTPEAFALSGGVGRCRFELFSKS